MRSVDAHFANDSGDHQAPDNVSKTGLTSDAARRQLAKFGPNAMPDIGVHPLATMAVEKFWAPVPWMLEAAIVLELLLGK